MRRLLPTRRWTPYALIAPSLLIFAAFFLYPVFYTLWLSGQHWDMLFPACSAGLENYAELFESGELWAVLGRTLLFSVASLVTTMGLGLLLALALDRPSRWATLLQGFIFSSYIVSWVGVSLLWVWLLDPSAGPINELAAAIGLSRRDWLGDPDLALWTLVGVTTWKTVGYDLIVYLAGLQSIPRDLLEAADLDGSTPWQRFRHVTWPLLRPTTAFLAITSLIMSFQAFDLFRIMTQGGPAGHTTVYIYYIWEQAFMYFRAGKAAAAVVIFFAIILALTLVQMRWLGRRTATGERF